MRQRPEQEALQVGLLLCFVCAPARMPPLLLPSNTKPFGVIILMLPPATRSPCARPCARVQDASVCAPALMPRSHAPATSLLLRTFVFGTHLLLRERASHNKTKIASVCVCLDSCLCVLIMSVCLDSCICVLCCLAIVSHTKCTSCTRFLAVLISFALE